MMRSASLEERRSPQPRQFRDDVDQRRSDKTRRAVAQSFSHVQPPGLTLVEHAAGQLGRLSTE
jgi:hypothetical protein